MDDDSYFGFYFPDEFTMFELTGTTRLEDEDDRWTYEISDQNEMVLRISLNFYQRFLHVSIRFKDKVIYAASHQGVWTLSPLISDDKTGLRAECRDRVYTFVDLHWNPDIRVYCRIVEAY